MKDKKKWRTKVFRFCLSVSFVTFLTMYIANQYGYFEYRRSEQVILTEEQIRKFEQDVKDGKEIDMETYLVNTNKNYQTKLSKTGLFISNGISNTVKNGVENFFNAINKMVTETE